MVKDFGGKYSNFKHVSYDAFSFSEKLDAIEEATGRRALPVYDFKKADVVVGFNGDFLSDIAGQSVSSGLC
ncbi:MAG: hypothetical protein U5L96_19865 [Owenweeksia sp.]|nr:hypothetical protein [Owenweeksia sp.]